MLNRREAIKGGLGLLAGTGSVVVAIETQPKEKPKELKPGQVWRDQWGNRRLVLTGTWDQYNDSLSLLISVYSFSTTGCSVSWVPDYSWRHWTYLGHISELGG